MDETLSEMMAKWGFRLHVLFNIYIGGMNAVTLSYEWIVPE